MLPYALVSCSLIEALILAQRRILLVCILSEYGYYNRNYDVLKQTA